ncbi:hypothetical protein Tco_0987468 [Tanacetum coccineum]
MLLHACRDSSLLLVTYRKKIIMVNLIPPDHVDDVPVVEPNQHDDVPIVLEPVLEDENEPELTYPYEEVDPLNPPPPAFESEHKDVIEVENLIEHEDETVPASVHEMASLFRRLCGREMAHALVKKKGKAKDEYYVEKLGNAKDKAECKKLKNELEEARVRAHEFYQEMIRRGFVFEERPNEAINVPIKDEKSPSSESRGSPHDS